VKLDYVVLSPQAVAAGLSVSDAEIKQYYEQHKADLAGEERRASHILLTVPKDAKPADKAKIKAEADALLKQLRADPTKFAELAKPNRKIRVRLPMVVIWVSLPVERWSSRLMMWCSACSQARSAKWWKPVRLSHHQAG
jgi:hypothetical protein